MPPELSLLHTYSIVARDEETGALGLAVQSHGFGAGAKVPYLEDGVAAVAAQAIPDEGQARRLLLKLRRGAAPEDALSAVLARDPERECRQLAIVDTRGRVATFTGKRCIQPAGHQQGRGYSVQGNMLANERVWPAMAQAFERKGADFHERLLRALEAAQREGGDIRGQRGGALKVVGPMMMEVDLRVDDHPRPIQELRRLLTRARAQQQMMQGAKALFDGDVSQALRAFTRGEALAPKETELAFWAAAMLLRAGQRTQAMKRFRRVFLEDRNLLKMAPAVAEAGMLVGASIEEVLAEAAPRRARPGKSGR